MNEISRINVFKFTYFLALDILDLEWIFSDEPFQMGPTRGEVVNIKRQFCEHVSERLLTWHGKGFSVEQKMISCLEFL